MNIGISIAKPNDNVANEDSYLVLENCLAVSDGAGGCGLYAKDWSQYLLNHLPKDAPITSFAELDEWVDGIWEPFYNAHEERAKEGDGILLNKFYNEGSCATLAALWMTQSNQYCWATYGDSVVFHYNQKTQKLEHSFTQLADFANPPRLISCKDPLEEEGMRVGTFDVDDDSLILIASDALSHYLMMMYEVAHADVFAEELNKELSQQSGNAQLLKTAQTLHLDFWEEVLSPLLKVADNEKCFKAYLTELYEKGLIDMDDYTLVVKDLRRNYPLSTTIYSKEED